MNNCNKQQKINRFLVCQNIGETITLCFKGLLITALINNKNIAKNPNLVILCDFTFRKKKNQPLANRNLHILLSRFISHINQNSWGQDLQWSERCSISTSGPKITLISSLFPGKNFARRTNAEFSTENQICCVIFKQIRKYFLL